MVTLDEIIVWAYPEFMGNSELVPHSDEFFSQSDESLESDPVVIVAETIVIDLEISDLLTRLLE